MCVLSSPLFSFRFCSFSSPWQVIERSWFHLLITWAQRAERNGSLSVSGFLLAVFKLCATCDLNSLWENVFSVVFGRLLFFLRFLAWPPLSEAILEVQWLTVLLHNKVSDSNPRTNWDFSVYLHGFSPSTPAQGSAWFMLQQEICVITYNVDFQLKRNSVIRLLQWIFVELTMQPTWKAVVVADINAGVWWIMG